MILTLQSWHQGKSEAVSQGSTLLQTSDTGARTPRLWVAKSRLSTCWLPLHTACQPPPASFSHLRTQVLCCRASSHLAGKRAPGSLTVCACPPASPGSSAPGLPNNCGQTLACKAQKITRPLGAQLHFSCEAWIPVLGRERLLSECISSSLPAAIHVLFTPLWCPPCLR